VFNLCDVLQECNLAVKQDLPIVTSKPPLAAASAATTAAANKLKRTQNRM